MYPTLAFVPLLRKLSYRRIVSFVIVSRLRSTAVLAEATRAATAVEAAVQATASQRQLGLVGVGAWFGGLLARQYSIAYNGSNASTYGLGRDEAAPSLALELHGLLRLRRFGGWCLGRHRGRDVGVSRVASAADNRRRGLEKKKKKMTMLQLLAVVLLRSRLRVELETDAAPARLQGFAMRLEVVTQASYRGPL